jgi:DNA repair protein RecO (recombination protein O)
MNMLKTTGFVLRKNDYREYDRIYTFYTDDFGKLPLLVRGARRVKSKLAPHLENFGEARVYFARGRVLNHLSGARVLEDNRVLLKNQEKINLVCDCFYLLDKIIKPEESDRKIYGLLKETMAAASLASEADFFKIKIYFFWRLADYLGYRPQLDECALCGRGFKKKEPFPAGISVKFNITENIIICGECVGQGILIKDNALKDLKTVFAGPLREFVKFDLDKSLIVLTEKARQIKLSEL